MDLLHCERACSRVSKTPLEPLKYALSPCLKSSHLVLKFHSKFAQHTVMNSWVSGIIFSFLYIVSYWISSNYKFEFFTKWFFDRNEKNVYSRETSLTYGYLINPMKMMSLWEGNTYAENATTLLNLCYIFGKGFRSYYTGNIGSVDQRSSKILAVKVRVLKKKSAASTIPADLCARAFGPGSNPGVVKSFSKFDSWQFWSPLT